MIVLAWCYGFAVKVLGCGSRKWTDRVAIRREFSKLPLGTVVVHGSAPGADSIIDDVARELGFEVRRYPADWNRYPKAAGPIRNSEMLKMEHRPEEPIDRGLAFTKDIEDSRGTRDMVRKLRAKFIPTEVFSV